MKIGGHCFFDVKKAKTPENIRLVTKKQVVDLTLPLFDWGKYYEKDGKIMIPISVQAHHSFVDGLHIGQFVEKLQNYFDAFKI
jgi:chloramphenicol O-acetyltransferase